MLSFSSSPMSAGAVAPHLVTTTTFNVGARLDQSVRIAKTERAFLLEDDEASGLIASEYLSHFGFEEVVWRRTLEDAEADLDDISHGRYDLVMLDVMLPDGTSIDLLRRLRSAAPHTPIGFYTAKCTLADRSYYSEVGCDFVFAKPLLIEDFLNVMKTLMGD